MPYEYTMTRRVEFSETDMAGIMHFANYFCFIESVEHAFFRSLGLTVHSSTSGSMQGWARVHASCDFFAPLRYQDEVEIHLLIKDKGAKSITYQAVFRMPDESGSPRIIARARWKVVCVCKAPGDKKMSSVPIPPEIDSLIQVAPPEALEIEKDS